MRKKVFSKILYLPKLFNTKSRKIVAVLLAALIIVGVPVVTYADFVEWNDETKEMAWTVYTTTQWADLGLIYATTDGSIAMADIPEDFRNAYGPVIDEAIASNVVASAYPSSDYKELLLAIIYTLNQEGNTLFSKDEVDICYWHKYMNNGTVTPSTVSSSIRLVANRLFSYANLYNNYHGEVVNIFSNDEKLAALVQSLIFTSAYIKENATYTPDNARDFVEANADSIADESEGWETFANEVLDRYSAITSSAHTTVG